MNTVHIKKGDTVQVISGKSKGKQGKVLEVAPSESKAIVEGVNIVSKHLKPRGQQQQGQQFSLHGIPPLFLPRQRICPFPRTMYL